MKKLFTLLVVLTLAVTIGCLPSKAEESQQATAANDSIDVIGWFCKNDTVNYLISSVQGNYVGSDTTVNASMNTLVQIIVRDSTDAGYRMTYTILDAYVDSVSDEPRARMLYSISKKFAQKFIGKTIEFKAGELGEIIEYTNLKQLKKEANELKNIMAKEFEAVPQFEAAMKAGLDFGTLIDTDQLVDGYLEDIKAIFLLHGKRLSKGETVTRNAATATTPGSETSWWVEYDSESGYAQIALSLDCLLPETPMTEFVATFVPQLARDKKVMKMLEGDASDVNVSGLVGDYYETLLRPDGWPEKVVKQKTVSGSDLGKISQTLITLDACSLRNFEQ